MQIILLLSFVAASLCMKTHKAVDTCDTVFCDLGQECVEKRGKPVCDCVLDCEDEPKAPVCGGNGTATKTYESECELNRQICLLKDSTDILFMISEVSCEEDKMRRDEFTEKYEKDSSKPKPVVCMAKDRDNVRDAIIKYMKLQLTVDVRDETYDGLLGKYFETLDGDADGKLDTMEFMKLIEKDQSITDVLSQDTHSNPILGGLCLNELMTLADENIDFKLSFEEFQKSLNPEVKPPKKTCLLEGNIYDDGEDVAKDCNMCKCACGSWVCTALDCQALKKQ